MLERSFDNSKQCRSAVMHWKSLTRFVTRRGRGRNKQRCTCHCTFWYISKSSSVQLRREISYKVAFNRGCERSLHSLLRAISSNREFVYYPCSRCNRRRFWSKSLIHNFHINHSAACLHPKFCISLCSISLGMTVVPRRNCKQCSCQIFFFSRRGGGGGDNVRYGLRENGE